jgi:hypothetical protein
LFSRGDDNGKVRAPLDARSLISKAETRLG